MCDFKPGDEVICVDDDGGELGRRYDAWLDIFNPAAERRGELVGTIRVIHHVEPHPHIDGLFGIDIGEDELFPHFSFRKVQRRDLSAWLDAAATDTDRWDKPIKAPSPLHPVPSVDALFRRIMAGGDR